jgi:hypothetical protein
MLIEVNNMAGFAIGILLLIIYLILFAWWQEGQRQGFKDMFSKSEEDLEKDDISEEDLEKDDISQDDKN